MTVYVLIAEAVYDHGIIGVYSTVELARTAAEAIWPETDGHHRFRIETVEIDRTYEGVFPYQFWADAQYRPEARPLKIDVIDKADR